MKGGVIAVLLVILERVVGSGSSPEPLGGTPVGGNGSGPLRRLTDYLLQKHNSASPPEGFIIVEYEIELVRILDINELRQSLQALVYVQESGESYCLQKWIDKSLSWDPSDFDNVGKTWLPKSKIWSTDILIFNMISHDNLLHSVRAPVTIFSNGTVICTYPAIYAVMCQLDISRFPLDRQICSLEVASWEYSVEKLELEVVTAHSLEHYTENEEWKLLKISVHKQVYHHEDFYVSELLFRIEVERKPLSYLISMVFPSSVITTLALSGLFATHSSTGEREEKFDLGSTSILSMSVLALIVTEQIPNSSRSIPLLVGFLMGQIILVAMATAATGLIMRVDRKCRRGASPPPTWLLSLLRLNKGHQTIKVGPLEEVDASGKQRSNGMYGQWDPSKPFSARRHSLGLYEGKYPGKPAVIEADGVHSIGDRLITTIEGLRAEMRTSVNRLTSPKDAVDPDGAGWRDVANRLDWVFAALFHFLNIALIVFVLWEARILPFSPKGSPGLTAGAAVTTDDSDGGGGH